ncbi:MAG TPA: M14 family zinc carboxypeptidase [Christiangramia sp.]|nr:M14 family zinc carboxypeptidase [Christiangramia sp.]
MKNQVLKNLFQEAYYSAVKFKEVTGRYITNRDLELFVNELSDKFKIEVIGNSVQDRPIKMITLGNGKIKILAWSQMHGNEGTTTKAVFDLLNAFKLNDEEVLSEILDLCTLYIIPILNPDGAKAYTRVNANGVDLNRDMQDLSQPESKVLMDQYEKIQPHYCLNLHDQRTIFSAGDGNNPATLSFLTPSKDQDRNIDEFRKQSMALIAGIAEDLSKSLKDKIGRYDDAFNINCAGDSFQYLNTPTILFEAGHYPGDYQREMTRKFVFQALISCLYQISQFDEDAGDYKKYFDIPENQKLFNDLIIRNAKLNGDACEISIQFKESLKGDRIDFVPVIEKIEGKITKFAHREIDADGHEVGLPEKAKLGENVIVNKIIINSTELEVKSL